MVTSLPFFIVIYMILLLIVFGCVLGGTLLKKWKNDWREQRWKPRKQRFIHELEQYMIRPGTYPPRMYLRGDFREWALRTCMEYESRFSGVSDQRIVELLEAWGFLDDAERWLRHRRPWRRIQGLHIAGMFRLRVFREAVQACLQDPSPLVGQKAFWALGMIGDPRDFEAMLTMLESRRVEAYQLERYVGILNQLDMDQQEAGERVRALFDRFHKPFVLRCMVDLLGRKGSYDCIPFLLSKIETSPDELKIGIIKALTHLNAYPALGLFKVLLQRSPNPGVQIMAMKGMASLGGRAESELLRDGLTHPNWWVRYYSAAGLSRLPDGAAVLADLAENHPDAYAREMARYFMQLMQGGELWRSIERSLAIG